MDAALVDVASFSFWSVVGVAVLLLTTIVQPALRQTMLAGINLGFLYLLLGADLAGIVLGVGVIYVLLRMIVLKRLGMFAAAVTFLGVVGLFVMHKLPALSYETHSASLNPLLATIGYSYVFLRLIELLRAVTERRHPPPNPPAMINFLLPFHMLAAGPIQAYDEFVSQPPVPEPLTPREVLEAIEQIAKGMFKKFVIAFLIRELFLSDFRSEGWMWFCEVQLFFLWMYIDFSAYSDIALGVGRLIGVATPRNFNRPYLARNMIDFWERWHISLSLFIRRNLFIPIQLATLRRFGPKRALLCANLAIGVSFLFCGIWHRISFGFLLWGGMHAVGLVTVNIYRDWLKRKLGAQGVKAYMADRRIRAVAIVATYEFVAFSLITFASP